MLREDILTNALYILIVIVAISVLPVEANSGYDQDDIYYLTEAIYFESGVEPTIGQIFVGKVILNRVDSRHWPNTIKEVVHQTYRGIGQFSYYSDGLSDKLPPGIEDRLRPIVLYLLKTRYELDVTGGANHYYNPALASPSWANDMEYLVTIRDHIFLKETR